MIDLPPMAPRTSILTDRPITHEEARGCAQRFINSLFQNPNGATVSIPADRDNDDDLVLMAYIAQQQSRQPEIDALRAALDEAQKEATIAWTVCASIHREYAKKRDPFYSTRQADFLKHETDCRATLARIRESKGNPNAPKT